MNKEKKPLTVKDLAIMGARAKWKGKTKKERGLIMARVRMGKKSLQGKEK